jgi:hypothetical protein
MKRRTIDLHIDELLLRDLPHRQRTHIAAAAEQELLRLLTERGLPSSLARGGHIPQLAINAGEIAPDAKPDAIGNQIAQQLYGQFEKGS